MQSVQIEFCDANGVAGTDTKTDFLPHYIPDLKLFEMVLERLDEDKALAHPVTVTKLVRYSDAGGRECRAQLLNHARFKS